jgi:hypothetical protein
MSRQLVTNPDLKNVALSTLSGSGPVAISVPLTLPADPTQPLQACTKQYADTKLTQAAADARYLTQAQGDARYLTPAQAAALYLPLTGGVLSGSLGFVSVNERIRTPPNNAGAISVESVDGYAFLSGYGGGFISGNTYYDGVNWQRFNVGLAAGYLSTAQGNLAFATGPAGANPLTAVNKMTIDVNGNMNLVGALITSSIIGVGGAQPIAGRMISMPNGVVALDNTSNNASNGQDIPVNGVWQVTTGNSFAGLVIVHETLVNGQMALFGMAATLSGLIWQTATAYSNVKDTAGKINVYVNPGEYGICIQNMGGTAIRMSAMLIRTRGTQ